MNAVMLLGYIFRYHSKIEQDLQQRMKQHRRNYQELQQLPAVQLSCR